MEFDRLIIVSVPYQIWDLSTVFISSKSEQTPPISPPTLPHLTICTSSNQLPCWVAPRLLATCGNQSSTSLEVWDVSERFGRACQTQDNTRVYRSQRTINCVAPPTSLSAANGVIVVGQSNGGIQLFDTRLKGGTEGCLQMFSDHKGSITDLYVVSEVN